MTAGDRVFATSKLFFAYALGNALLIPLRARASDLPASGAGRIRPRWPP